MTESADATIGVGLPGYEAQAGPHCLTASQRWHSEQPAVDSNGVAADGRLVFTAFKRQASAPKAAAQGELGKIVPHQKAQGSSSA